MKIDKKIIKELVDYLNEFNLNDKYFVFSGIGNHKTFISDKC